MQPVRREIQMVFQDPFGSLNPRRPSAPSSASPSPSTTPPRRRTPARRPACSTASASTPPLNRYPHEFSGGQRQRIGIARALALAPSSSSATNPSPPSTLLQAQVLNLLADLQRDLGLSYLFIAHNLAVVGHFSDRVAVMYLGHIVEIADAAESTKTPNTPTPSPSSPPSPPPTPTPAAARQRILLTGDVPSPVNPPSGCRFHPRCPKAQRALQPPTSQPWRPRRATPRPPDRLPLPGGGRRDPGQGRTGRGQR